MENTRRTQPYRKGARPATLPLFRMLQGRPVFLPNPQDIQRRTSLLGRPQGLSQLITAKRKK